MHVRTANSRKEVFFPLAPPFFKKRKKVCNEDHKFVATSLKLTEFINSQTTLEFAKDPSGKPEISEADLIEPNKKSGTAANTSNNSSDSSDSSDIEIMRATEDGAYLRNK